MIYRLETESRGEPIGIPCVGNVRVAVGVHIAEGVAIGANSLVMRPTKPFGIYFGNPAKRIAERSKNLIKLKDEFLSKFRNNKGTWS